jgi:tRNA modification GTPase
MSLQQINPTICAISTPAGQGAIAIIRVSGSEAFEICDKIIKNKDYKKLTAFKSHVLVFSKIIDGEKIIDEALVSIFKAPHSYTGEDSVEISCHGSRFIQQKILQLLINHGAQHARAGEFTMRAYMNGKMDLSQAEAVADLISSSSEASHKVAVQQMKGGISKQITFLRERLLHFASLIELELDFSEEDVEFANRQDLSNVLSEIETYISKLLKSFEAGNVIKNGITVAIAGKPNVGKSTLLNALLNEERAIVSEIPGTTRDSIEDTMNLHGYMFRFIDTAGLRETHDSIENLGIERARQNISNASIILYLCEAADSEEVVYNEIKKLNIKDNQGLVLVINKIDKINDYNQLEYNNLREVFKSKLQIIGISAKKAIHIDELIDKILALTDLTSIDQEAVLITNSRHFEILSKALKAIMRIKTAMADSISNDLLAIDIRDALYHLGEITGEISTDDILGNIFKNFCIGK